ncbi:uncharacterized protein C2845_PM08G02510 [Panicum miliaceum]|uniref:Pentatricopeptide repeat-containing protein n=1 Tax=Panicum miliaceum TaxID=4540 RepID=A0A3L6R2L0_PANMI|nr:uncharacterized protein C2845_PM08G02510 [Panicum miliaceum]
MHRLLRAIASPPLGHYHHQRRHRLSAFAADQPIRHHPPIDSAVPWNKLLRDHLAHSRPDLALALYRLMRALSPGLPNSYTLPLALRAAPSMRIASTVHAHALHLGLHAHPDVAGQILAAYARLGRAAEARHVFDALPVRRTTLSWNTLITAYSIGCDPDAARAAFARMVAGGSRPDAVTWTTLLSAHARCGRHLEVLELFRDMHDSGCEGNAEAVAVALSACPYASGTALAKGRAIHAYGFVKGVVHGYMFVTSSLVCMYGKLGEMEEAEKVFQEAREKNAVTWNALITSYAAAGMCNKALDVLAWMEQRGGIVVPNVVSWSAVIGGFASSGNMEQALELFRQMQQHRLPPNVVTSATVLSACADLLALRLGQEVLQAETETTGNHMLITNLYATSGMWEDSKRVRVMTKEAGLRKNPGQSWIEVKNKVFAFTAGNVSLPEAEEIFRVLDDLYSEMEDEKHANV